MISTTVGASVARPLLRPAARERVARRTMDAAWQQFFVTMAIILLTDIAARGSGVAARGFFILAAGGSCLYYIRRSPWLYITMSLWLWSVTPLIRRLIDFHAGFDPVNFVLGVPEFVALMMVPSILNSRELMRQRETLIGLFIAVPILYGVGVSFVQGQIVTGVVGSADWVGPVLIYFYVIANWRRIGEFQPVFTSFLNINIAVIALYSLIQFVAPPGWDVAWVTNSGVMGADLPVPFGIRVFATLNSAGILAAWAGSAMLLFLAFKNRITPILVPLCAIIVILTYVRSAAGAVLVSYLVAALLGRGGIFKMLFTGVVGVTALLVVISAVLPQVNDLIVKRATSVEDLSHDSSASERQNIYQKTPAAIAAAPFGVGIGAVGRGAVAASGDSDADLSVIDSGPLGIYLPLGWVAGSAYILGIILMMVQSVSAARLTRSPAAIALTAAAFSVVALLPFHNVTGLQGLMLWFPAGYAAAIGMEARITRRLATRPVDRFVRSVGGRDQRAMP